MEQNIHANISTYPLVPTLFAANNSLPLSSLRIHLSHFCLILSLYELLWKFVISLNAFRFMHYFGCLMCIYIKICVEMAHADFHSRMFSLKFHVICACKVNSKNIEKQSEYKRHANGFCQIIEWL